MQLFDLDLSYNRLSGTLPSSWALTQASHGKASLQAAIGMLIPFIILIYVSVLPSVAAMNLCPCAHVNMRLTAKSFFCSL